MQQTLDHIVPGISAVKMSSTRSTVGVSARPPVLPPHDRIHLSDKDLVAIGASVFLVVTIVTVYIWYFIYNRRREAKGDGLISQYHDYTHQLYGLGDRPKSVAVRSKPSQC